MLQLIAEGRSNKGIGDRLALSERGVQKHVTAVFGKFGLAATRTTTAASWPSWRT